ncbi:MAG: iron ABC transporter permease [Chloroflexota bacterium]|nr:iron ABC transporter permease [Chloroflexota bacterium]
MAAASPTQDRVPSEAVSRKPMVVIGRSAGLLLGLALVAVVALLSLRFGAHPITTSQAWNAIFDYDSSSYEELVVRTLRLPRTVIALGCGAALAVTGAVMQAITRNPLADSSILGVSGGASFAIVTAIFYLGITSPYQFVWFAFAGALAASVLVFVVGASGRDGATPIKLTLAGVVISSLLAAWTSALVLLDEQTMDVARFWMAGSVAGRPLDVFWVVSPFLLAGTLACVFLGHQLNVMSMGEETARSLGMNTARTRIICGMLVVLITGAATAAAGPIGFVGLAVPHMVRAVIGPDYRWILAYSVVVGAIFLTAADILGRVVLDSGELQVGIVTALAGAPFLVYLARKRTVAI